MANKCCTEKKIKMNVIFINEQTFKDRTGVSKAIEGLQIRPMIKVAQDVFVMPALGSTLYARLQNGVENNDLNSNEVALIENYVTDCLVWATMAYLAIPMGYQLFSKGFIQKNADNSNAPSKNELDYIGNYYQDMAEHYKQRMIGYLKANYTLFAEYADPGCGWDIVKPESLGYECPIYLGDVTQPPVFDSSVPVYSHPKIVKYVATGGESTFSPSPSIDGKTILLATRAGVVREVVAVTTTNTNEIQVVGNVVTLPTGDLATAGEVFKFMII